MRKLYEVSEVATYRYRYTVYADDEEGAIQEVIDGMYAGTLDEIDCERHAREVVDR